MVTVTGGTVDAALPVVTVYGINVLTIVAVLLLVGGIVASVSPVVPGPLVSLLGVLVHWVGTGFAEPGPILLVVLVLAGLLTFVAGLVSEVVAARVGGASAKTTALGVLVGLGLAFFFGVVGLLVGIAGTVFVVEAVRKRDVKQGAVAAIAVVIASFASTVVQIAVTTGMFVTMLVVILG